MRIGYFSVFKRKNKKREIDFLEILNIHIFLTS